MILKHYHSYIVKLCLTNGFNEAEQFITYVDEYMLRQLEIKLIEAILKILKSRIVKIKLEKNKKGIYGTLKLYFRRKKNKGV